MSLALRMALFGLVALGLTVLVHYYVWARLVRDPAWRAPARRAGVLGTILLGTTLPVGTLLARGIGLDLARPLLWVAYVWLGVLLYLLLVLGLLDLARLWSRAARRLSGEREPADGAPADPSRRVFLSRVQAGAAAVTAVSLGGVALKQGLARPEVVEVPIALPGLPPSLEGTTIVQLSDVHVGPTIGREFMVDLVRRTNALSPDLVAITGDLVDGTVAELGEAVGALRGLRARHGVYFVTGNHEYFSGVEPWMEELARLGIRVLRNERVAVGSAGATFDLAGVDDWSARAYGRGHGPDLERALAGRERSRALVLLAHQPRQVDQAARLGVGLQLSGHTHGGQLWPWNHAVRLQQPYVAGLVRHGPTQLYINPGTGYWGPPMRLGTRAEITKIVLARG